MERINFENNVTKANADTFNTLQDNIENAIDSIETLDIYSTSETRIGTWLGKPLYRKVIETTTPAVSTDGTLVNKSVAVNVDNVDFIYVDKAIVQGGGNYNVSAIISTMSFNNGLRFEVNSTNIVMYCNSTIYGNAPAKVVVEYTKTTD